MSPPKQVRCHRCGKMVDLVAGTLASHRQPHPPVKCPGGGEIPLARNLKAAQEFEARNRKPVKREEDRPVVGYVEAIVPLSSPVPEEVIKLATDAALAMPIHPTSGDILRALTVTAKEAYLLGEIAQLKNANRAIATLTTGKST